MIINCCVGYSFTYHTVRAILQQLLYMYFCHIIQLIRGRFDLGGLISRAQACVGQTLGPRQRACRGLTAGVGSGSRALGCNKQAALQTDEAVGRWRLTCADVFVRYSSESSCTVHLNGQLAVQLSGAFNCAIVGCNYWVHL